MELGLGKVEMSKSHTHEGLLDLAEVLPSTTPSSLKFYSRINEINSDKELDGHCDITYYNNNSDTVK